MTCAENCAYIKANSFTDSPVCNWPAAESFLFGSPLRRVRGTRAQATTWIGLASVWFHDCLVCWVVMSSSADPLAVDRSSAVATE